MRNIVYSPNTNDFSLLLQSINYTHFPQRACYFIWPAILQAMIRMNHKAFLVDDFCDFKNVSHFHVTDPNIPQSLEMRVYMFYTLYRHLLGLNCYSLLPKVPLVIKLTHLRLTPHGLNYYSKQQVNTCYSDTFIDEIQNILCTQT